ncbi:MAG TPA: hypothetical protein VK025_13805 [Steroidobacter sp.]|nr:hypothetical protein [Steroidobacter sp.]
MARSKQSPRKKRTTRAQRRKARPSTPWPTIEAFLDSEEGDITLGSIDCGPSLGYTAVASDGHDMLVALVRRRDETLHQLLTRLEQALGPALEEQIYIDEINGPA